MPHAVETLLATLDLEQLEDNLFRGRSPASGRTRVFGGQVVGQALVAASRTVMPETSPLKSGPPQAQPRTPHSLHGYFMLPGDPQRPIIYEVERIRDGRSFTTRRVVAVQRGEAIFSMSASFHILEPGLDHAMPLPDVPSPENLPGEPELRANLSRLPRAIRAYFEDERPIELRPVEMSRYLAREPMAPKFHVWIRATAPLPDDPAIHRCVLAYASDMILLDTSLVAHGRTVFDPSIQAASLDHALWFHRPFRADDWLLYAQDSPSTGGARGFSRGLIYSRDGALVASVAQEGLIRERRALPSQ